VDSSIHPGMMILSPIDGIDTGRPVFLPWRMSSFVLVLSICWMLANSDEFGSYSRHAQSK